MVPGGSSPRVRGKRREGPDLAAAVRLIPARAGKTARAQNLLATRRAHPRACGENGAKVRIWPPPFGSSPRVRGKPRPRLQVAGEPGLIPARAGKTAWPHPGRGPAWAHPRACGENSCAHARARAPDGSSPRVRGKPVVLQARAGRRGLIPARAGKTARGAGRPGRGRAHPRACGENCWWEVREMKILGSSPRVRGKQLSYCRFENPIGLIPARAGKTRTGPWIARCWRAHPRACGENLGRQKRTISCGGSSPRVRGKPRQYRGVRCRSRLIPARAGKTR